MRITYLYQYPSGLVSTYSEVDPVSDPKRAYLYLDATVSMVVTLL